MRYTVTLCKIIAPSDPSYRGSPTQSTAHSIPQTKHSAALPVEPYLPLTYRVQAIGMHGVIPPRPPSQQYGTAALHNPIPEHPPKPR